MLCFAGRLNVETSGLFLLFYGRFYGGQDGECVLYKGFRILVGCEATGADQYLPGQGGLGTYAK